MNTAALTLDLDFGAVGIREKHAFAVRLHAHRLLELIEAASVGCRVYELMAIQRVGDLWLYVDVEALALPPDLQPFWSESCPTRGPRAGRVPFETFDAHFMLMGDDTLPPDEAWRLGWNRPETQTFAAALFRQARAAAAHLEGQDVLMTHELGLIRRGRHAYEGWPRSAILAQTDLWYRKPEPPRYAPGFYATAQRLMQRPEIEAVSHRGEGDYHLLRLMCIEQRRRADFRGIPPGTALRLSSLSNRYIDNEAWGSEMLLYDEGLGWGDLWIEAGGRFGAPVQQLLGTPWQKFGRWILSIEDLGVVPGYQAETGPGWVLYEAVPGTRIPRPPRDIW